MGNWASSTADWLSRERLRRLAFVWIAATAAAAVLHLWSETRLGLTNGHGNPLGEDFINYWSGAVLAARGQWRAVYDFAAFHAFERNAAGGPIDLYHYSYPPVMLMLSAPLACLPYVAALVAWSAAGWAAFAFALRRIWPSPSSTLYALAVPAVFANLMTGQNGLFSAAILGLGLSLLPGRPVVAGALFGALFALKPQLALLLPVALLAERNWRALAAMLCCALILAAATVPLYGWPIWSAYAERIAVLRHAILENGATWPYMPSIFVMARRLSAPVGAAYAAQALASLGLAALVLWAWSRKTLARPTKNALLALCVPLATPYIQNYDLAIAALAPVWLLSAAPAGDPLRGKILLASAAVLAAPMVVAFLARLSGAQLGWLLLLPALWLSARDCLASRPVAQTRALPQT
jgi:hypothetical protein